MNKPQNYDQSETSVMGDFKSITPGGHICKIEQATVSQTKTGKEVLIILFDIAEGEFKDFYSKQFSKKKETNSDAKWQGVCRQLTEGNSLKFFKGMLKTIEESNNGYKWNWDETTLKGKLFGGVFGEEEYLGNDGSVKKSTKCMQIRTVKAVKDGVEAPPIKKLINSPSFSTYDEVYEVEEEDIPF